MSAAMTAKRTTADIFETVTCSRCGGEKRLIQYSNVLGGTCFKCGGAGRTFTLRGSRDLAAYRAAVAAATLRPVAQVRTGDSVRNANMKRFVPVVAISEAQAGFVDIKLNHEVWFDLGCPLSYKGDTFSIELAGEIGIWPGAGNMPVAEAFATHLNPVAFGQTMGSSRHD